MMKFDVRYLVSVVYLLYLTQSVAVRTEVGVAITAEKVNATGKEGMVQKEIEVAYAGGNSRVLVIDVATNAAIATIEIADNYLAEIVVASDGARAYVRSSSGRSTISVIDTAMNVVLATISINERTLKLAISSDGTRIYVTQASDYNSLTVIDTATNQVISTVSLERPKGGIVVSPDGTRVYVITEGIGAYGNVHVIDTATNEVITAIPVGFSPSGILVTPDGSQVYVVNNPNSGVARCDIKVIDTVKNAVVDVIPVGVLASSSSGPSMIISPDGTRVYVLIQTFSSETILLTIELATKEITTILFSTFFGTLTREMIISPDGTQICIIYNDGIWIVDTKTNQLIDTVPMKLPERIAFTSDGTKVYGVIRPFPDSSIALIDIATRTVTYTSVNFYPLAIAIARINQ
jgi:YVTN family beta-propeller protein